MTKAKELKTLFFKHGRLKFGADPELSEWPDISFSGSDTSEDTAEEQIRERIVAHAKDRFVTARGIKHRDFVTSEEFEDLRLRVKKLERIVQQTERFNDSKQLETAIEEAYFLLKKVKSIREIQNHSERTNLTFLVLVDHVSADIFRKIAKIQVHLSKTYSDLCVEIRPIINQQT